MSIADLEATLELARLMLYLTPIILFVSVGLWWYWFRTVKRRIKEREQQ